MYYDDGLKGFGVRFSKGAAMAGAIALVSCFANFGGIFGPIVIGC
ncbi:MAG: hypothetical protein WB697_06965 [Stellaceae bacterium]